MTDGLEQAVSREQLRDIERRLRERGAVLDMPLTQSIYKPLLEKQRRDGVDVERDHAYGDGPRHRLDVYRPSRGSTTPLPVILFFHGGGFVRGDKSDRENVGQYFARQGIVTFVANYRLAPSHQWPAGAEDVSSVYQWVQEHAGQFGGAADKIFLVGESAGAAHVAAATLIRRFHPRGGLAIAGAVLISGVYHVHLEHLARSQFGILTPDPRNEPYFGTDFDRYESMSTVELIDASPDLPLLITFAELDMLQMQVQAGELFARLVTQHGFQPRVKVIPGHNHLSQNFSINTGDKSLSGPVLQFIRDIGG